MDKKFKESEEKVKRTEKNLATSKSKVTKLEKTIEDQEQMRIERETRWKTVEEDLSGMEVLNESLKSKCSDLEGEIEKRNETIKNLVRSRNLVPSRV